MIWKTSQLSQISKIGDGAHASLKRMELGIPYLTAKNITESGVDYSQMDYISEETYNKYFKEESNALTQPRKDDILYSIIGSIGGVYVVKEEKIGISSSVAIFRVNSEIVIPQYLAYFLKSKSFDAQVQAIKGGVAQGFMSLGKLGTVTISYPDDVNYQKRIVDILYAYDSLVENSQKQINLLEEAAQRLYKEWFVDLRFPNYEECKIVDGIPEGWKRVHISDVCETVGGGTPSTKVNEYYQDGDVRWVTPTDITRNKCLILLDSEKKITKMGLEKSSARMVPPYTILMTSRASVGYFGICEHEVCTNQGFISCIPYEENIRYFLLYNLMNRTEEIRQKASGSTFLEISKKSFREFEIILPASNALEIFNKVITTYIKQMEISAKKMSQLWQARERLLPKLMCGKIKI